MKAWMNRRLATTRVVVITVTGLIGTGCDAWDLRMSATLTLPHRTTATRSLSSSSRRPTRSVSPTISSRGRTDHRSVESTVSARPVVDLGPSVPIPTEPSLPFFLVPKETRTALDFVSLKETDGSLEALFFADRTDASMEHELVDSFPRTDTHTSVVVEDTYTEWIEAVGGAAVGTTVLCLGSGAMDAQGACMAGLMVGVLSGLPEPLSRNPLSAILYQVGYGLSSVTRHSLEAVPFDPNVVQHSTRGAWSLLTEVTRQAQEKVEINWIRPGVGTRSMHATPWMATMAIEPSHKFVSIPRQYRKVDMDDEVHSIRITDGMDRARAKAHQRLVSVRDEWEAATSSLQYRFPSWRDQSRPHLYEVASEAERQGWTSSSSLLRTLDDVRALPAQTSVKLSDLRRRTNAH